MCKKETLLLASALAALLLVFLLPTSVPLQKNAWGDPLADPAKDAKDKTYVGRAKCASCHLRENTAWKKSKHAKAFEDLSAQYKEDKSCLACHVTGYGEPTGFKSAKETPQLAGVVCEACHGPGSEHAKLGDMIAKKKRTSPIGRSKSNPKRGRKTMSFASKPYMGLVFPE